MESGANETTELQATTEQQERDHLEGLERERHGLPYSKTEHEHNLRRIAYLRQVEQDAMRRYTNYTLTILTFAQDLALEKHRQWNDALQQVHGLENCSCIVFGRDAKVPRRTLVLFGWSEGTSQQQMEDTTCWSALEHLLESPAHAQHIALNTPGGLTGMSRRLKELVIIRGSDRVLDPPDPLFLFELETLAMETIPQIGHDPPIELAGYTQGITPSINGQRTVSLFLAWVDEARRDRFVDPTQPSYGVGGNDQYEQRVALKVRELEAAGAQVDSYLCYLETWYPPAEPALRKGCCLIM